jgi:uncharacterized paraquat-inducible protein A
MLYQVTCSACGLTGGLLVEDGAHAPRCPRCGAQLTSESVSGQETAAHDRAIDDQVLSWLSQTSGSAPLTSGGDLTCRLCGYEGLMQYDSAQGDSICPACMAVYTTRSIGDGRVIDCPGCGQAVTYGERDRGKTILCPACKYFLGCLVPAEKHRYRARSAWKPR